MLERVDRGIWRGRRFRSYFIKRIRVVYDGLLAADQSNVKDMLDACDMTALIDMCLAREMGLANNREA